MRANAYGRMGAVILAALVAASSRGGAAQAPAEPVLRGQWLLPTTGPQVFAAAAEVVRATGFEIARQDRARGLLVTREGSYGAGWPDAEALGLLATQSPAAASVHVYVTPGVTPARLAVGAILVTRTTFTPLRAERAFGDSTTYGHPPLGAAIAVRIAERLGAALVPMPADVEARARQAMHFGDGRLGACGPPPLIAQGSPQALVTLVSEVKPQYPRPQLAQHIGGVVQLSGEVTEHGTLVDLQWMKGVEDQNLVAAARGAASLWRFSAPVLDGCPVRRRVVIEMSFRMQR